MGWLANAQNDCIQLEMNGKNWKCLECPDMDRSVQKLLEMAGNSLKWLAMAKIGWYGLKWLDKAGNGW